MAFMIFLYIKDNIVFYFHIHFTVMKPEHKICQKQFESTIICYKPQCETLTLPIVKKHKYTIKHMQKWYLSEYPEFNSQIRDVKDDRTPLAIEGVHPQLKVTHESDGLLLLVQQHVLKSTINVVWGKGDNITITYSYSKGSQVINA